MDKENKEILYSDFTSLGSVMSSVLQDSNLKQGVKKASVFKFWPKVVGKKFEKYSRPETINQSNVLLVACANAAVSSELTMFKADILKKINVYSKPLGIEISDINFSHKIWKVSSQNVSQSYQEPKNPYKRDLTGFNPDDVVLDANEVEAIRKSVENNKFASEEQRKKMFDAIILDLKIQKFDNDRKKTNP